MFDLPDYHFIPPPTDWLRLSLLFFHLLSCAFSLALVLSADWRIFRGSFTTTSLEQTARHTATTLGLLWISGILLIYHDTGMDLATLASMTKLQLKLVIVVALTINGLLLHVVSFPLIAMQRRLTLMQALMLSITGSMSTSHWLLAAFVGVARPLGQWPLQSLLAAYALYVSFTLLVAVICTPFIRMMLTRRQPPPRQRRHRLPSVLADSLISRATDCNRLKASNRTR